MSPVRMRICDFPHILDLFLLLKVIFVAFLTDILTQQCLSQEREVNILPHLLKEYLANSSLQCVRHMIRTYCFEDTSSHVQCEETYLNLMPHLISVTDRINLIHCFYISHNSPKTLCIHTHLAKYAGILPAINS